MADPQLGTSDRKQNSIFTHSGNNFVFGNIMSPQEVDDAKNVRIFFFCSRAEV